VNKQLALIASLLITAWVSSVWAQSPAGVRGSLPPPVTEIYQPEKDIQVTVNYDQKGEICDLRLNGPSAKIDPLAKKLIPERTRGRLLHMPKALVVMNCCNSFQLDYANVSMTYFYGNGLDNIRFSFPGRKCVVPQPDVKKLN
jgi:hypothetical protein